MRSLLITLVFIVLVLSNLPGQTLGSGEAGLSDQNPIKLNKPIRFSTYKNGSFLFVDFNNYAVRKVDGTGMVNTFWR